MSSSPSMTLPSSGSSSSRSSGSSPSNDPNVKYIHGHCMYRPNAGAMDDDCPFGYVWRNGHYRRKPGLIKYVNRFERKVRHRLAKHPVLCEEFENLDEFHNCMRMVEKTMEAFLLRNPSSSAIRKFTNHLVERVITCAGKKLRDRCFLQPTPRMRRYIENEIAQYTE